jgi:hypothetical protein
MPVYYEPLNVNSDRTTTRTVLHEIIPLTGTIVSGTYGVYRSEENIKNYTHGMFQSVYDYPYLSSSANHIFDITMGYDESSPYSGSSHTQNSKKINIYNQFSQVLLGYTGSANVVRLFESDLKLDQTGSMREVFFIPLSRLVIKDQIKKGSFSIAVGTGSFATPYTEAPSPSVLTLTDASASEIGGTTNTLGGDFGVLHQQNSDGTYGDGTANGAGVIFYQAGIAVLTASIFGANFQVDTDGTNHTVKASMITSSISGNCDALRRRIQNVSFNNSTEINSTIYFCRLPVNKFNYSSNPTYVSGSKIRVKNVASDLPVSYVTTVGLYNSRNELLATAKLSEPLKKTPQNELTIRVRLDY